MKAIIECRSEKSRYLVSTIFITFIILLTWALVPLRFETNDDVGIMYIVAGYQTGTPSSLTLYTNILFGYILSGMYTVMPMIPWYGITHIFLIYISLIMIFKSIIKVSIIKGTTLVVPFTLFFLLYIFFLSHYTAALQFSTTPAMAGAAACVLAASLFFEESKRARFVDGIAIAFLMFFSYIIRPASGNVIIGYFAVVIAFKVAKCIINSDICKQHLRFLVTLCICTTVPIVSAIAFNTYQADRNGINEFLSYNSQRSAYMHLGHTPYDEAPELYASIGWDNDFYSLVQRWFFMDERFTDDKLVLLNEHFDTTQQSVSGINRLTSDIQNTFDSIYRLASRNTYVLGAAFILTLVIIIHAIVLFRQKNWLHLIFLSAVAGGLLVTSLYLGYIGRFSSRAFFVTLIPAACLLVWNVAAVWQLERLNTRHKYALCAAVMALLAFFILVPLRRFPYEARIYRESALSHRVAMEQYAIENPDNIYIFDHCLISQMPVLTLYKDHKPSNLFFWGGTSFNSPVYTAQLNANGLDELYIDALLQPGFYFITQRTEHCYPLFEDYMKNTFNAQATVVDTLNGVYVIQFTRG